VPGVSSGWDDDDWTGTPPEGRHSRDRAKPDFWRRQRPVVVTAFWVGLAALVVVVLILAT
jgi:hypothetical protein